MKEPCAAITLDLHETGAAAAVTLKQADSGRKIAISLSENGFPYEIAGDCYAVLTAAKPDGSILYNHCDMEGNTIVYEVTEQTTAAVGRMMAEVKLYGADDKLITSALFRIIVNGTVYSDKRVESRDEVSALTHLVSEASTVILEGNEAIQQAISAGEAAEKAAQDAADFVEEASRVFDQIRANSETAVNAAVAAVQSANKANADAQTALNNANAATQGANLAAQNASDAATAANAAAEATNTARESLTTAASSAIEEIRNAATTGIDGTAIVQPTRGEVISIDDSADRLLRGLKVFGKTTQNGTPTPEAPVPLESVGDVTVTVAGKNLLKLTPATDGYLAGFTVTFADAINLSGTTTQTWANITGNAFSDLLPAGEYLFSIAEPVDYISGIKLRDRNRNHISSHRIFNRNTNVSILCEQDFYVGELFIEGLKGSTNYNMVIKPMVRLASITDDRYEPYKEAKHLSVSTPNGMNLPGIPVTSGGNYTDPVTKQQWICDEVDFEKGVYVQRVGEHILKENGIWNKTGTFVDRYYCSLDVLFGDMSKNYLNILCSNFAQDSTGETVGSVKVSASAIGFAFAEKDTTTAEEFEAFLTLNTVKVNYVLAEEKRYPLSEIDPDALAQYAALHSNYPNTTVFSDSGAGIEVKYVADTRLYIDQKFNELAAALVSNV